MSAYLEVVEGPDAGRQIPLDHEVTIGRDESADVALSDPHASRRHCSVALTNGSAIVRDLESSNGTFVNSQQVVGHAELGPGDDLLVGVTVLELRGKDPEATRPLSGVAVRPFVKPVPVRRIGAVWRKTSARVPAIEAVAKVIADHAK